MGINFDLTKISDSYNKVAAKCKKRIIVCAGTGCIANGSLKVYKRFVELIKEKGLNVIVEIKSEENQIDNGIHVSKSGCQGFCQMGPLVTIMPENIMYTKVKETDADEIVEKTIINGTIVERLLYKNSLTGEYCKGTESIPFYKEQNRIVLNQCGVIDPESISEYVARGGYQAAIKVITKMNDAEICKMLIDSGLRGRGGGGFPTGRKWELARVQVNDKKYVICNGDEGDPGAFMDRSIMEGNPHSVIEGMIIAAKAINADEGYVYVRTEYPLAVERMKKAVIDARNAGILGKSILGSDFNFDINVMEGAGAFVCGEETALIASIEGKRGMPSPKPPFPAQSGLFGKPTVINNVETLATVPIIINIGPDKFKEQGTASSPGTKTFAITGHVVNTGLIEVPFGSTLKHIVYNIAGGVLNDNNEYDERGFKAVQIGGPSGGCLTPEHQDIPLDFESLKSIGAMVGSGGLVIMNKETCIVQIARFFMQFTQNESCGKCIPCREGTKQLLNLLDDILNGTATGETLDLIEELALTVQKGSLCGLGKSAPNPVLSTLKHFREEYEAHVYDKYCPAGKCKALAKYAIDAELCKGCGLCAKKCPVEAITGEKAEPYIIDAKKCIKCGECMKACKFNAVKIK